MQATRSLEGIALGLLLVTTICLVFYVGTERSRTRGMAVAIMIMAFFAGKPINNNTTVNRNSRFIGSSNKANFR